MHLQKIIFLLIIVSTGIILIVSQFQNQENFAIQVNNSGPYIGAEFPKQLGFTGDGVKIGIIDTGINIEHPDFFNPDETSRFLKGYDFVDNDSIPRDTNGHGTQVAGIIGAIIACSILYGALN